MTIASKLAPIFLLAAAFPSASDAQVNVPPSKEWVGTWRLDVRESMFSGAAPKSESRTIEIRGRNMVTQSTGEAADGKPTRFSYAVKMDGQFHPLVGNPDGDSISVELISPGKIAIEVRRHGKRSATAITSVGPVRMIMERHRLPLSGSPSDDRLVYDRVR